jgi:DNA helicase-2/ATP-dependent DNA helicase PcrA
MAFQDLNPQQQQIVCHLRGGLLALAPVGTGKTTVLAERLVHAIDQGFAPDRLLCLTFTNRAAKELGDRLRQKLPQQARQITTKTFHGLCASILRMEAEEAGIPRDFVVYDDNDRQELLIELGINDRRGAMDILKDIAVCKEKTTDNRSLGDIFKEILGELAGLAQSYQAQLQQHHALDFDDLVSQVRSLFRHNSKVRERWQNKFDLVQVDEVQDTNLAEYEIIKQLAIRSGNLAFIGDLDQTIYSWRGSEPIELVAQFEQDFQPTRYALIHNYRSTQQLLKAADGFAQSFAERHTQCQADFQAEVGEPLEYFCAPDEVEEGKWIGDRIQTLAQTKQIPYHRIAILTRSNARSNKLAQVLTDMGVPCITAESYDFFQRQEVKDAIAHLKLLINPKDGRSARRVLLRPSRGIGEQTIETISSQGKDCGLHLSDFLQIDTFTYGEPLARLRERYRKGKIVVFDVETTGLSASHDEVVEIAAITLQDGRPVGFFHEYIQNTKPVGASEWVHGFSDDFLQAKGKPAPEVYAKFRDFTRGALLVGHNVGFDVGMVTAHARRAGLILTRYPWEDTWDLAVRLKPSVPNFKLETLCQHFNLATRSTHHALDDTKATVELLVTLLPQLESMSNDRARLTKEYKDKFQPIAVRFASWRDALSFIRPSKLLDKVLRDSGLYDFYSGEPHRAENLVQLSDAFHDRDDPDQDSYSSLRDLLEFAALAKNIDSLAELENRVPIVTVHQSKGLEFSATFIAGLTEGEFPSYPSVRDGRLEEEKRLFYVALTRAKQYAFLSSYQKNDRGYSKKPSPFIASIPENCFA